MLRGDIARLEIDSEALGLTMHDLFPSVDVGNTVSDTFKTAHFCAFARPSAERAGEHFFATNPLSYRRRGFVAKKCCEDGGPFVSAKVARFWSAVDTLRLSSLL